ncbi:MAG: putative transport system permease protein [Thermotogota bacterium]|nr:putative transport system permease protein [Thermotogota bacterium]MDK2864004.1 putative transport system permease protein [Thermotogota bacterium]
MLLVGGLALNDSISKWIEGSLSQNFGTADAYVENRRNNPFFKVAIDTQTVEAIRSFEGVLSVLPVSETMGRIKADGEFFDCLIVGVSSYDLKEFAETDVTLPSKGALVSRDLAELLSVEVGDTVEVNMGRGSVSFTVTQIGEKGVLNFKGEALQYAGTVFVNIDDFQGMGGFPTRVYLHLSGTPQEHITLVQNIKSAFGLKGEAMKAELIESPANKALGYLTIAFSSFSIVASLILVYIFAQSFVEERNTTMATLRILGMKAHHISIALMLEGVTYLLVSGFLGGSLGIALGGYLLARLKSASGLLMAGGFHTAISKLSFHVSPLTLILGAFGGLVLPTTIFLFRIRKIASLPPVTMLRMTREDSLSLYSKKSRRVLLGVILVTAAVIMVSTRVDFWLFALLLGIIGLLIVVPSALLSLGAGLFVIMVVIFRPVSADSSSVWVILQRGAAFFLGSWLVFLFVITPIRKLFSKLVVRSSTSAYLALSYVERNRRNTFIIASMFSLIIFVMILVLVMPYNIERFVREKLETGLFGYDFMIITNPLKLVFGSGKLDVAEELRNPSKVYVAEVEGEPIAFVDEDFLEHAVVPVETTPEWRKEILEPGTVVVGYLLEDGSIPAKVSGRLRSPFRLGKSVNVDFKVIGTFDVRQLMVPVRYVASVKSLPEGVKAIPVLLGKVDPEKAEAVKDYYRERFDFPVYITEEMNRVFSGIDLLIQTAVSLLYFGLISGFSGISFHALRSVVTRRRLAGTLKAIGMSSKDLGISFALENLIVATIGIAVGAFAGFLESRDIVQLVFSLFQSGTFTFPAWNFLGLILAVYVIIAVVVAVPVLMAAKTSPAEALRAPE